MKEIGNAVIQMTKYKTIRMTQEEYDKIKKARELLLRRGVDSIPEEVFRTCPDCGELMNGIKAEYYQCPKCGHKEGQFNVTWEGVALGAVAATAAVVLIYGLYRYFNQESRH